MTATPTEWLGPDQRASLTAICAADSMDMFTHAKGCQERRQANNPNPSATAEGLSSHNLGLAIDVTLSFRNQEFTEISTNMLNVDAMRSSAIYKWLALNADRFGWFPWNNEPWHWEYLPKAWDENPP